MTFLWKCLGETLQIGNSSMSLLLWYFITFYIDNIGILGDFSISMLLGSKELGTNVLELHFVMLANHDQSVLVLFRLARSICFYVKLESSDCRIYCVNLPGLIDRKLDSIDRNSCRLFFCKIFQLSPSQFDL